MRPRDVAIDTVIDRALQEDLAQAGDITTDSIVHPSARAEATFVARASGTLAGMFVAERVFGKLSSGVSFETIRHDGDAVEPGETLARVSGDARAILTGERTALNFLGHLSGIATLTARYMAAIGRTPPEVVATRKTTPGLRGLEKYAVRCGGGGAHRYGLYDAVLIKDNHIAIAGGIRQAVERARSNVGHLVKVQVEVDTLEQLDELLQVGADAVLLDNMAPGELRDAVGRCRGKLLTEASGGITLETIRAVADTGVDQVSVGALTHSAPSLDIGLDIAV